MKKSLSILSIASALLAIISSCIGVFYSFGGEQRIVENIYGQEITLFGDGVYANDSIMKVGATKGTDVVTIIIGVLLVLTVLVWKKKKYAPFIQAGLLSLILYSSTCLILGVTFNRLFLVYLFQFGCTFFAFILAMNDLLRKKSFEDCIYNKRLTGTAIFIIIGGCSVLQWMAFILPTVISGSPMEIVDIYTTEPTFVIDLAIIFPLALFCGISLLAKKTIAYQLVPVLLMALTGVGICVIFQTIVQSSLGIVLNPWELFGLVIFFVIIGIIAMILNVRLLRKAK